MPNILIIDSSYSGGFSVAIISSKGFNSLSLLGDELKFTNIWVAFDMLFTSSGISKDDIDVLGVSKGPGPFSSIRTGMTIAKTLYEVKKVPVITFSIFDILSEQFDNAYFFVDGKAKKFIVGNAKTDEVKVIKLSELEEFVRSIKKLDEKVKIISIGCYEIIDDLVKKGMVCRWIKDDFIFYEVLQATWIRDFVLKKYEIKEFSNSFEPLYV